MLQEQECRYGAMCMRPDCKYKHNIKKINIPCIHFNNKGCYKGDKCPYLHIMKPNPLSTQVPEETHNEPKNDAEGELQAPKSPIVNPPQSPTPKSPMKSITPPRSPIIESKPQQVEQPEIPQMNLESKSEEAKVVKETLNKKPQIPAKTASQQPANKKNAEKKKKAPQKPPEKKPENIPLPTTKKTEPQGFKVPVKSIDQIKKEKEMKLKQRQEELKGENSAPEKEVAIITSPVEELPQKRKIIDNSDKGVKKVKGNEAPPELEEGEEPGNQENQPMDLEENVEKEIGEIREEKTQESVDIYFDLPSIDTSVNVQDMSTHKASQDFSELVFPQIHSEGSIDQEEPPKVIDSLILPQIPSVIHTEAKEKSVPGTSILRKSSEPEPRLVSEERPIKAVFSPTTEEKAKAPEEKSKTILLKSKDDNKAQKPAKPVEGTARILTLEEIKAKKEAMKKDATPTLPPPAKDKSEEKEKIEIPAKRQPAQKAEIPMPKKKVKAPIVSYEEWKPFSQAFLSLNLNEWPGEVLTSQDIEERKQLAAKLSTPEGLTEIIEDLESKISKIEIEKGPITVDPEFESLSLIEKIDDLYQKFKLAVK
ncbi:unnamed protein product [Blepharisma stoltei]|uniref:C3H1-type domain-containing protein n=1 Tax=Blepharisma stoltei TaxID=1481888 RepID=A0AAU9K7Q6_9CILI|nr:unnamed protein product [Blepharisma stoltei]